MPQIGQEPGPVCRICGCMGHVYSLSPPLSDLFRGWLRREIFLRVCKKLGAAAR